MKGDTVIRAIKSVQVEIDLPVSDMRLLLADLTRCVRSTSYNMVTKDLRDVIRSALNETGDSISGNEETT